MDKKQNHKTLEGVRKWGGVATKPPKKRKWEASSYNINNISYIIGSNSYNK